LHYYLSKREDSAFWRDNRLESSAPESLLNNLRLWAYQPPSEYDFPNRLEIFNLDNYLYVLYGMEFETRMDALSARYPERDQAQALFQQLQTSAREAVEHLLPNRELIRRIKQYGLQKV